MYKPTNIVIDKLENLMTLYLILDLFDNAYAEVWTAWEKRRQISNNNISL